MISLLQLWIVAVAVLWRRIEQGSLGPDLSFFSLLIGFIICPAIVAIVVFLPANNASALRLLVAFRTVKEDELPKHVEMQDCPMPAPDAPVAPVTEVV